MIATWTAGKKGELELSADTGEWLDLAELLHEERVEVACVAGEKPAPPALVLQRLLIRREARPRVMISVSADRREALISGDAASLERFGRAVLQFGQKMRVGQTACLESRGDDHWLDPASVTTILHICGEVRERDGEVGG
ncbi:MAG: hypothetical protein K8T20_05680 [Planctomycetes bacterium]|nr:hypothetical protein [Planctomycetota bacterium]